MPDNIFDVANRFRRNLLAHERESARAMVTAYGDVWLRTKARLDALNEQIRAARAAGESVNTSWLFQRERLQIVQLQVEAEIDGFSRYAGQRIAGGQAVAVDLAEEHAERLVRFDLGERPGRAIVEVSYARLPREAVTDLVGFLHDGSPLSSLLDELGPSAGRSVRKALIAGVATGQNPRAVAASVRSALGGNLVRALTIARTEMLRSYREASGRSYRENSDVVQGWIWHSALGPRTCAACWAMHGTFHRLNERLDDHPNGRCTAVPVTRTWKELGIAGVPETRAEVAKGPDVFARLSEPEQLAILGPAKHAAYQEGTIDLTDLVKRTRSRRWGTMRSERSLTDILAARAG